MKSNSMMNGNVISRKVFGMKVFLYLVGFVFMVLAVAFQGGNVSFFVRHELTDDFSTLWYPVKHEQKDGKMFSMELPMEPEAKHAKTESGIFERIDSYKGDRDGVRALVVHATTRKQEDKVGFGYENFQEVFTMKGEMAIKGEGIREIQGRTVKTIECTSKSKGQESTIQLLGFQEGQDVWWLLYQYNPKNDAAKARVENSIETITVQ